MMNDSSKLRDVLFAHMDEMSFQMDALSSLSEIKRNLIVDINSIAKSIEKGRCVNRQIESMLSCKKQQKVRVA